MNEERIYEAPAVEDRQEIIGLMGGGFTDCAANNLPPELCQGPG